MTTRSVVTMGLDVALECPPAQRSGRLRLLVVSVPDLGWGTYAKHLRAVTDSADEIDAVHVLTPAPLLARVAGAKIAGRRPPGHLDPHYRRHVAHSFAVRRWVRRHIPEGRFDAVHVSPHLMVGPVHDVFGGAPISTSMDSTVLQGKLNRRGGTATSMVRRLRELREVERSGIDAADAIVCFSRWCAAGLNAEYGRTEGVIVQPPSLRSTSHRSPGPPSDPIRMIFVGNDFVRKGGDRLLRWHQTLFRERVELHICSAQAPSNRQLPNVVIHGSVPHAELIDRLLPSMDLFVLPTRSDQSPWAVVEALNAGVPVITSNVGGVAELVPNSAGHVLDPEDDDGFVKALVGFVQDEGARRTMIEAAGLVDGNGTWDLQRDQLVSLWKNLAK